MSVIGDVCKKAFARAHGINGYFEAIMDWDKKRLAKKTNCKELMGMKSMKGIVMLFKGKITLQKTFCAKM